jgi:hypothetical protein
MTEENKEREVRGKHGFAVMECLIGDDSPDVAVYDSFNGVAACHRYIARVQNPRHTYRIERFRNDA